MINRRLYQRGFSLVELLIVITIIGILSGFIYGNFSASNAEGRDAKRQADLRMLQSAIVQYKAKYGRYPAQGCGTPASTFATEALCSDYIVGHAPDINFVPEFLPRLPKDPRRGDGQGFAYMTNDSRGNGGQNLGTVYKAAVLGTVESEIVTYKHPLKRCDYAGSAASIGQSLLNPATIESLNRAGWCARVTGLVDYVPSHCKSNDPSFQRTYAVWGGYATSQFTGTNPSLASSNQNHMWNLTQKVICR